MDSRALLEPDSAPPDEPYEPASAAPRRKPSRLRGGPLARRRRPRGRPSASARRRWLALLLLAGLGVAVVCAGNGLLVIGRSGRTAAALGPGGRVAEPTPGSVPSTADPAPDPTGPAQLLLPAEGTVPGSSRSALPWPAHGQAALAVDGFGLQLDTGSAAALPIASVTKVMTAYVILRDHPLAPGRSGPLITVLPAEAAAYPQQLAQLESVVRVTGGETLTERQALQALLIASADNIAAVLARWDAGSPAAFSAKMNAAAARLGMRHTRYTDPSGLDPGTVSTATDQLTLARRAMELPVVAEIVAQQQAWIPVAGVIKNYNTLLGTDGVMGIKTGSTRAAGGCLLLAARRTVAGRTVTVLGAVLGQPASPGQLLPNVLAVSDRLLRGLVAAVHPVTLIRAGQPVAVAGSGTGSVRLAATRDVTVPGWPGMGYRLSLAGGSGSTPATLRVQAGSSAVTVPLEAVAA